MVATPIGPGLEWFGEFEDAAVRAVLVRACRREAVVLILIAHATQPAKHVTERWLASIDASGFESSPFCKALHEVHTVDLPPPP